MSNQIERQLSAADRMILHSYSVFLEGLSDYLGSGYELVLHSLEDLEHSVVKIINGHHPGRRAGAPITDLALEMLEKISADGGADHVTYFGTNKKGEPIKSSTVAIRGEGGRIIGLMCMNLYLNMPLSSFIGELFAPAAELSAAENFADNVGEVIENAVSQVRAEIAADSAIAANLKNKQIVSRLKERGIFKLKDAVVIVADLLGISKNTVYLHLRNSEKE